MKAFLLMGQSNMAGRGDFGEVPEISNSRCFILRNGRWQPMSEPINPDRQVFGYFHSGVGLAASFADEYAKYFQEDVGLIPCADGNTSLKEWMPGEILYENAVLQAGLAKRTSEIVGILWHQGENDCKSLEEAVQYHDRFVHMLDRLKKDLELTDIPVMIGELGDFVKTFHEGVLSVGFDTVNQTLQKLAAEVENGVFVSSKGLACKNDGIHFDSKSYREFGKRYFQRYLEVL